MSSQSTKVRKADSPENMKEIVDQLTEDSKQCNCFMCQRFGPVAMKFLSGLELNKEEQTGAIALVGTREGYSGGVRGDIPAVIHMLARFLYQHPDLYIQVMLQIEHIRHFPDAATQEKAEAQRTTDHMSDTLEKLQAMMGPQAKA